MTAGETLRQLRGARPRNTVAHDLGISERTLIRHEDGTTPLTKFQLTAYANYYGVPVETFRDGIAA